MTIMGHPPLARTSLRTSYGRLVWAVARLVAVAVIGIAASLSGARAHDESNAQFWLQERARQKLLQQQRQVQLRRQQQRRPVIYQRPTHLIRRAKPVRGFTRASLPPAPSPPGTPTLTPSSSPAPATSRGSTPPASEKAAAPAPKSGDAFTVAVMGDGLAAALAAGLTDAYADRPDISILSRVRNSSGLVRDDYFNWIKAAQTLTAGPQHIDMAVMMIGSNDHQPLRDSSGVYPPFSPQWTQIYASRVETIDSIFQKKKIPLAWVGMPIMKERSLSDAMLSLNDILRGTAQKDGATYLDIWDLFTDETGQYALYGPDVNGDTAKLRGFDGVNFTPAGGLKLAQVVETEIKRVMDEKRPRIDPAIAGIAPQLAPAEPLVPARLISPSTGSGRASNDLRAMLPAPAAPIHPVIPVKPAAGPVVALTAPVVAPNGQLATTSPIPSSSDGMKRVQDALTDGRPIATRPGRADDFTWPRN